MDPITLFLINFGISLLVAGAKALVDMAVEASKPKPGVKGTISTGGDLPMSFIMGRYGTAGHLEYAGTWGEAGGTPNAYLVQVISVSDLPVSNPLVEVWVNGELCTLDASPHATYGYPVLEYRVGGKDHLWVKAKDGSQTVADTYLTGKFGAHAERPWLSDMIGRGIGYLICTALVNRELMPGIPSYFFVVDGIENYDPRTDDIDDDTTWSKSDNPLVQADNILRGIYYDGEWVFGLQGEGAQQPNANAAQMDKCDVAVSLDGGGTEPRFRTGAEITVDTPARDVVLGLLASCNGRIAEIAGSYKVLVGEPDASVYSFTDEDVVISEGQSFEPFPGLEATTNGAVATYVEPAERWASKDAAPRYSSALELEDDGRRLPASIALPYVYSGTQVQRLMKAMVEEARRFRSHSHTAPPEMWEFEPLDAVSWTSDRNGYVDKVFLLTGIEDLPNGNQVVALKEQEPTDYDWTPGTDELPVEVASLVTVRPAAQALQDFDVTPTWFEDAGAVARIPAITCEWEDDLDDVRAVALQVRLDGLTALFLDIEVPYVTDAASPGYVISEGILPETDYEVRARPLPYGQRATSWTTWRDVTTVDVAIDGLKLDLESVDTPVIVDEAVTQAPGAAQGAPVNVTCGISTSDEQSVCSFTFTPKGGTSALLISARFTCPSGASNFGWICLRLYKNGSLLKQWAFFRVDDGTQDARDQSYHYFDPLGTSSTTYALKAYRPAMTTGSDQIADQGNGGNITVSEGSINTVAAAK